MAAKDITPDKQSVESCLKQKTYYIDFYQREYVWKRETVEILLRDIFYAFDLSYEEHKDEEMSPKTIDLYNWYYLNVFITNNVDGKVYIVDGQQRLTTLTLIATKLYHLTTNDNLKDTLKECIFAKDKFKGNVFCIDNEKRRDVMQSILDNNEYKVPFKNATESNLIERYQDVSRIIDEKGMDSNKLEAFIYYFLERLVLVELSIDKEDTPMVFEVINDRGEALKPFEILKGKLLGMLSKTETDGYSAKWESSLSLIENKQDSFFVDYLKSKYVFKSNAKLESILNNSYHRYIFENNEIADDLMFRKTDKKHIANIKQFINVDLPYYASLYAKICSNPNIYLKYNNEINGFSGQYQNIMAACCVNDPDEDLKIERIAYETDRMWILMVLNGIYDSNDYQNYIYALNELLPGKDVSEFRSIYDSLILSLIRNKRNIQDENIKVSLLDYPSFQKRNYTNLSTRFLRYYFARIEDYICCQSKQNMQNDVIYVSTRTGNVTGYHIEHILSNNEENVTFFENEEEFNEQRNMLGGLLLLKGINNVSSGNEKYKDKLKTYSNGFVLGHSLCADFYHANKDFDAFNTQLATKIGQSFRSYDKFDKEALYERCKLIYLLTKVIWDI